MPASPSEAGATELELPAPSFDEPTPPRDPAPVDDATDPLPGVEEPSMFEPDDEPPSDAHEPAQPLDREGASLPSSAADPIEASDGAHDDADALADAPNA